jgi:quercetin dioxygenase-like cupin family protein
MRLLRKAVTGRMVPPWHPTCPTGALILLQHRGTRQQSAAPPASMFVDGSLLPWVTAGVATGVAVLIYRKRRQAALEPIGVAVGVDAAPIDKPRMTVHDVASGVTEEAARQRLAAAGYEVPSDAPVQVIHCERDKFNWRENGFSQVFADVEGSRCRILDYAPGQGLQPHLHDADEKFVIGGGSIKVFKWRSVDDVRRGAPPASEGWLEAGATLAIPADTPHAIYAHPQSGVAFHEVVGDVTTRIPHQPMPSAARSVSHQLPFEASM